MSEMIKANRDATILIKEADKYVYHVQFTRIQLIDPLDLKKQERTTGIQTFANKKELALMEKNKKACGYDEARVVHDPVLLIRQEAKEMASKKAADEALARKAAKDEKLREAAGAKKAATSSTKHKNK